MTVRDAMCITIAAATYRHEGNRWSDVLDLTGYTPARFAQVVNHLLDDPEAERTMPMEVRRLRRVREARARARGA